MGHFRKKMSALLLLLLSCDKVGTLEIRYQLIIIAELRNKMLALLLSLLLSCDMVEHLRNKMLALLLLSCDMVEHFRQ